MKTAIIIHGMPSKEEYYDPKRRAASRHHFLPWLQRQLILNDVLTQVPEMPAPYAPDYKKWEKVFEQFKLDKETILIGHSCGAGFLVRYLSEHKMNIAKLVLIAPWLDPHNELESKMFSFDIDSELTKRCNQIVMVYSTDDDNEMILSIDILNKKLPGVSAVKFSDKGHFTFD